MKQMWWLYAVLSYEGVLCNNNSLMILWYFFSLNRIFYSKLWTSFVCKPRQQEMQELYIKTKELTDFISVTSVPPAGRPQYYTQAVHSQFLPHCRASLWQMLSSSPWLTSSVSFIMSVLLIKSHNKLADVLWWHCNCPGMFLFIHLIVVVIFPPKAWKLSSLIKETEDKTRPFGWESSK